MDCLTKLWGGRVVLARREDRQYFERNQPGSGERPAVGYHREALTTGERSTLEVSFLTSGECPASQIS